MRWWWVFGSVSIVSLHNSWSMEFWWYFVPTARKNWFRFNVIWLVCLVEVRCCFDDRYNITPWSRLAQTYWLKSTHLQLYALTDCKEGFIHNFSWFEIQQKKMCIHCFIEEWFGELRLKGGRVLINMTNFWQWNQILDKMLVW